MNIATGCPVSLTPAPAGWWVQHTTPKGEKFNSRIVAWAIVTTGSDEDGSMNTDVQPVFLEDGSLWTRSEWYDAMGTECSVAVIEP